jgi:methionyl-tRNA synthetase
VPGTPIAKPTGVFTKLDAEAVIEAERGRLGDASTDSDEPAESVESGESGESGAEPDADEAAGA